MSIFKRRGRAIRLATTSLLLIALLALIAACGDDDDNGGGSPTATGTASEAAPSASATEPTASFPFTFTDSTGEDVTIGEQPERILSYSPAATEVLYAVGAGDQVVAVDEFSNYPEEAITKQRLTYSDPSPEIALAEEPDLVIMATRQEGQVEQFRALDITVVLLAEPEDLQGVLDQIETIGTLTGHSEEAEALIADLQDRIDTVTTKVADIEEGPKVFYEITPDLYTVSPDSFIGGVLTTLKARNIAEGATTAFPQLSAEVVIAEDPEVIILTDGSPTSGGQSPETVAARPGWSTITAVVEGRIHAVDPDVFSRPGPRIVDALEELAELLYPEQ